MTGRSFGSSMALICLRATCWAGSIQRMSLLLRLMSRSLRIIRHIVLRAPTSARVGFEAVCAFLPLCLFRDCRTRVAWSARPMRPERGTMATSTCFFGQTGRLTSLGSLETSPFAPRDHTSRFQRMARLPSSQTMERTATRHALTFSVTSAPPVRATRAAVYPPRRVHRRLSFSR
jgi:hypothetical protein